MKNIDFGGPDRVQATVFRASNMFGRIIGQSDVHFFIATLEQGHKLC